MEEEESKSEAEPIHMSYLYIDHKHHKPYDNRITLVLALHFCASLPVCDYEEDIASYREIGKFFIVKPAVVAITQTPTLQW